MFFNIFCKDSTTSCKRNLSRGFDYTIALVGNPNVGKSTLFNAMTGMHQHTGNWPGKTVTSSVGYTSHCGNTYRMIDLPGTYSLVPHSAEEEVTSDFLSSNEADIIVAVCDATCLERNLILLLQIMKKISDTSNIILCVNLLDEANRKNISIDLNKLSTLLGIPVVGTVAKEKKSIKELMDTIANSIASENKLNSEFTCKNENGYDDANSSHDYTDGQKFGNFYDNDPFYNNIDNTNDMLLYSHSSNECEHLDNIRLAEFLAANTVYYTKSCKSDYCLDQKIDRFLTSRAFGYPSMFLLLLLIFWITISFANYPSAILSDLLFGFQDSISKFLLFIKVPIWLHDMLVLGLYRVVAWVVSVMLPPMAIFFPLFTLLEDLGYLPRIAYNLDKCFHKCNACGKQALTMCMGFGCNAVGVTGCRIIDSPRERLIAILTNSFVPCNGRFPTLIALISIFFIGSTYSKSSFEGLHSALLSALYLTSIIILGTVMTFFSSKLLSLTVLKGLPSSFVLELPPYRRPKIAQVIVRSILDRTVFVLARAVIFAAPAGIIIWIMANMYLGDNSILEISTDFLDPFAKQFGMDGVILMAFILGIPANEIVLPIIMMSYLAEGYILEYQNLNELYSLLIQNGWTWITALCTMLFSLMHWPCGTTLITIYKETGSIKWVSIAFLLPTAFGLATCFLVYQISTLFFM